MDDHLSSPTALLRREHELILKVSDALAAMARRSDEQALDWEMVSDCITFLRLYVDAFHHSKEEDFLFPSLVAHGLPGEAGPVAVMLFEHDQGREMVSEMVKAAGDASADDPQAAGRLRDAALGFQDLITAHIGKENGILFGIADQIIEDEARRELGSAYESVSERLFEGHSKSDLEAIASRVLDG
ncbi:MAG: hemerythrin [Actinomycetia bacterium]|nr:hemerythrin [Actinomycetes bacterium]MCP4957688.1 hemerythrin [Actinomycetes bacterium]